jgi:hypothetical protein
MWNRMIDRQARLNRAQMVRIGKEKMKIAKGFEQNYSDEIFEISKVVCRTPRPLYELCELRGTPIEGQFYNEEVTPVTITRITKYKIDKMIDTRVRCGIRKHLVRGQVVLPLSTRGSKRPSYVV